MTHALIIDDDLSNLGVLQQLLTLEGISHTAVQDATQVEAMLPELAGKVDVIIMDLEMPDLDGYQLFQILKSHPQFRDIPIIACTVHINELNTARDMGFDSFLSKPLNLDCFGEQLASILNGNAVWQGY